jgi:hypothetical protein
VVGKIVRAVRRHDDAYVDTASLALFNGPVEAVNETLSDLDAETFNGLDADVTVLSPGGVIVPIAIYK